MLKRFAVENFRNFRDRIEIRFDNVHNYGFNRQYVKDGLLNKVVLVGRNGTGKTNLGLAVFDIYPMLVNSLYRTFREDDPSFLNGDSNRGYATFEYVFELGGRTIEYTYSKTSPDTIVGESMKVDGTSYFFRNGRESDYEVLKRECAENLRIEIEDGPLSVLRYVWANTVQKEDSPVRAVIEFVEGMLYFTSNPSGNSSIGLGSTPQKISEYIIDNGLEHDFQECLSEFGGIDLDLYSFRTPESSVLLQRFDRTSLDLMRIASSGTRVFMTLYYWSRRFDDITFLYMDEFDAYYHFEMAANVLKYVAGKDGFQTVLTTHNTSLIGNDLLRPDCYMLLENGIIRSFADSTDRELREGHNLEKMYRNGEFDERTRVSRRDGEKGGHPPNLYSTDPHGAPKPPRVKINPGGFEGMR